MALWNWKASISSTIPSTANPQRFSCPATFRVSAGIPARDRVVDFGKYKGKMLGSIPSTYLKWVSKNLRAGDMEDWAKMADQVLEDPVYRDRMEWEAAEKILNGDNASHCSNGNGRNAVSELLEISERFGWDNEDKRGWSRIDFGLLGTSKGGRIPRVDQNSDNGVGVLRKKTKEEGGGGRRRERMRRLSEKRRKEEEEGVVVRSPFPGREALLKKVASRRVL